MTEQRKRFKKSPWNNKKRRIKSKNEYLHSFLLFFYSIEDICNNWGLSSKFQDTSRLCLLWFLDLYIVFAVSLFCKSSLSPHFVDLDLLFTFESFPALMKSLVSFCYICYMCVYICVYILYV